MNPLGVCAIGGTSFPINRKRISELLGFGGEIINSIDAISSRDHIIFTLMNLTLIANCYTRIAEDFIIFTSKEFDFIEIDDGYASVSSVMPQKKNPDTLELIKGKMGRIYGGLIQILFVSKGVFSGYSRDFQESKIPLKEAFDTIKDATKILTGIFKSIKLKPQNMRKAVDQSMILALDLAEYIAKNAALSFREAHSLVGALVKKYNDKKKIFNQNNIRITAEEIFNKKIKIDQNELDLLHDLEYVLKMRKSLGSPNKENINQSIKQLRQKIAIYTKDKDKIKSKIEDSVQNIIQIVNQIINSKD